MSKSFGNPMRYIRPAWLAIAESLLVALAALLLIFPRGLLPWVGLSLILAGWALRSLTEGGWLVRTPLDRPILILFLTTITSLYPSVDLALSLPKFYGIVLGFAVYYATCGAVSSRWRFWLGAVLLMAALVAISFLGLIGTDWSDGKYPMARPIYGTVPQLIRGIQTSLGPAAGFHPNELGGALAFLLPVPLALFVRAPLSALHRGVVTAMIVLGLGVVALSASRSALVGLGVSVAVFLIWRWRRIGLAVVVVSLAALGVTLSLYGAAVADFVLRIDRASAWSGWGSLPPRLEIWDRARYMIEDFPFTGIGLNTFPIVLDTLYPSFLAGPDARIPHAHNIFLQTAVDLGLGGLLGFLGLCACTAYAGWRAYRSAGLSPADESVQAAIVGLLLGLLAYLTFGLTDAITLGAKPTVLLWLMMGLIVSAERLGREQSAIDNPEPRPSSAEHLLARAVSLALTTARDTYWIIAFFLVGMGYLVVGLGISGWAP